MIFYGEFEKDRDMASKQKNAYEAACDIFATGAVCAAAAAPFLCGTSVPVAVACGVVAGLAGKVALDLKKEAKFYAEQEESYNELYINQELDKERRNSGNNREQMRSEIRDCKKEIEDLKNTKENGMKESIEKKKKIEELEANIAKNSEILQEGCLSRKERAENKLKERKAYWDAVHHQRS